MPSTDRTRSHALTKRDHSASVGRTPWSPRAFFGDDEFDVEFTAPWRAQRVDLEFLPSGDAALTRRATKASQLSAVVVRWSTRRNRYERQGILAEPAAIEQAAQECLSDADLRARRRTREQNRRADQEDTPTPDEFADAESDVMEAAALMAVSPAIGMIEYQQATSRYADLVGKAEEAAKRYHASASDALTGIGNPIVPCPPIASQADIPEPPGPQPDPEFEFNTRPERLDHTFADKHKLGGVVQRAGGWEEAMPQILDGLRGHVPSQGRFEAVINVSGENVTVRGFVDSDGMIKIGTAFIS